jgi:glucose-6-phosphate 1-dehydrogenase
MNGSLPTHIIILGGGGDLAQRKLLPALFDLFCRNLLPHTFRITGLARTERTSRAYRELASGSIQAQRPGCDAAQLALFSEHIEYVTGSLDEKESYRKLAEAAAAYENAMGRHSNRLFYCAVPPQTYGAIFASMKGSGLARVEAGWSRILVEKPFGNDAKSAEELNAQLQELFDESQIFRIDHYLAKEALQSIMSLRFSNTIMESAWNAKYIAEVRITLNERASVDHRGAFYDSVGALRDVGQNHILQMLALAAMDEPKHFSAEEIREKRTAVLERLMPLSTHDDEHPIRGQYAGYTDTPGVDPSSSTETYFAITAYIDSDTWRNVPFYLRSGKALHEDRASIEIIFKDTATGAFQTRSAKTVANTIRIDVSPQSAVSLTLNVKERGHAYELVSRTFTHQEDAASTRDIEAYEKVLLDALTGDQTLFTTAAEIAASWKFIDSVFEDWKGEPMRIYEQGSAGPEKP